MSDQIKHIDGIVPVDYWITVTTPRGLNVRSRPNITAQVMNRIPTGTRKHITGLKHHQGYLWGEIENKPEIIGQRWIALRRDEQVIPAVDYVEIE